MARGLFITGFIVLEVLAIQRRAKGLLLEGKAMMNWHDADTSTAKQFTMPVDQVLEECGHAPGRAGGWSARKGENLPRHAGAPGDSA